MSSVSGEPQNTEGLLRALELAGREYAGRSVMYHQAIADSLGVNVTDLKCLDLAREIAELTPGKLAELTGLTTGSITVALDRLERAGYIRRLRDPRDRRKVIIQPILDRILPKLLPIFASLGQAMGAEFGARYDNHDLALILDFIERSSHVLQIEAAKLRVHTSMRSSDAV